MNSASPKEPGQEIASQYEEIADWFDAMRSRSLIEIEYLSLAVERAPTKGAMLDLGCGGGEPIARFFINQGFRVTGVDTSPTMIGCCKERFPDQTWILGDMRELKLASRFDVIVAWDSFFHLNHESQRRMFRTFRDHCEPDAVLVFTSGPEWAKPTARCRASSSITRASTRKPTGICSRPAASRSFSTRSRIPPTVGEQCGWRAARGVLLSLSRYGGGVAQDKPARYGTKRPTFRGL